MKVAVIGAGIMGASTAYHLAQKGTEVHLFDSALGPARGVTNHAFGWINTINTDPSSVEAYDLRVRAVEDFESLLINLPELTTHIRRGSLIWKETPELTASFAATHRSNPRLNLVTRNFVAAQESRLNNPPDLAIHSPHDIAINPNILTRSLIDRARQLGAITHYGVTIQRLETTGHSITAIHTDGERLPFDLVILTAGTQTHSLLQTIGLSLNVEASPVVLLRYQTNEHFLHNVLSFPDLEIRQTPDNTVLIVEDFYGGCDQEDFAAPRKRVSNALRTTFKMPESFNFTNATVGNRPIFSNGLPRRGFVANTEGLYLVVGHPGIILAPLLGRLAAEEID